ncbi:MAG: DciA family protein [Elusimicrobium sp.]|jgi:hypothetical protein|nr:DciA family protein [Elusimicrobium sp.]
MRRQALGAKPRKIWNSAADLARGFNPLNLKLNRLMVLNSVWSKISGAKGKYWVLDAATNDSIYIKTKSAAAKHDLAGRSAEIIKELNKYFDKPWIKKIEII